ncbi:MAG: cysteine hydrolase family protein [Pirellulales bacterium]|nr:cysteine hydrolase family protein [Pirellulales bacterium]
MIGRMLVLGSLALSHTIVVTAVQNDVDMLKLHARCRQSVADSQGEFAVAEKTLEWQPRKTAVVVVDMWDQHWCRGAAERVAEVAGPLDKFVSAARQRGLLIVHCPSTCVDFYQDSPARRRAVEAPFAKPPIELAKSQRWGTAWAWPDKPREPDLPIDDTDMGCDCEQPCTISAPWTRQTAMIAMDEERDAITDNGQELYNLFAEKGIDNVIICGVHLNMCVLGRPFAIRELVKLGKNVVLVRDLTDTMYNHRMRPYVKHFAGTDLVVEHVEKYWCPSIVSTDLVSGQPFRFQADHRGRAAKQGGQKQGR